MYEKILDQALASPNGVRLNFRTKEETYNFRMGLYRHIRRWQSKWQDGLYESIVIRAKNDTQLFLLKDKKGPI